MKIEELLSPIEFGDLPVENGFGHPVHVMAEVISAHPEGTPQSFISALRPAALASAVKTGIPAGVTAAQAALETGWGRYVPVDLATGRYSYNLFGVKALNGQDYVTAWTWEYDRNAKQWLRVQARFRAYPGFEDSLDDHARLLRTPRYLVCLRGAADAEGYARCIASAGYATDPSYADKIISIMRRWNLVDLKPGPFPDVSVDDAGAEAIAWCKAQGLMVGRDDGRFHPDEPMTRREMAIMAKRLYDATTKIQGREALGDAGADG